MTIDYERRWCGVMGEVLINPIICVIPIEDEGKHESWFWWSMTGESGVA